jgi:anti-sigma regulatory factor (Ser/Thr protein kinase)
VPGSAAAPATIERELELQAEPSHLSTARRFAEAVGADFGLEGRARYELTFAVNEAVSNAIEHGCPSADGTIQVRAAEEDDTLVFYVADYGRFVPEPSAVDAFAERGRGLAFMAATVDEVDVRQEASGTIVRLCKRRAR